MKILTLFPICIYAWGQTGVEQPQLGKMLDSNGALRTVYGITAGVTLGDVETTGVISAACSQAFCLLKTDGSVVLSPRAIDQVTVDAPAGPAMFAFDGDSAFVWFPQSRQLARWHDGMLDLIDSSVQGEVLSIRASAGAVEFAVRRFETGVWIVTPDGSVLGSLPPSAGPVMLIPGGAVYSVSGEIVIRDVRLPLDRVTSFSQMSENYLQVRADGVDYSLRIDLGRETLFQLPGVQQ